MVEAPFAFFEMEEEAILAHTAQFEEAKLGVAPEAFDAVDVVFAAGKLVLVMMNAVVFAALEHEAVAGFPALGADVRPLDHPAGDDRHQLLAGTVFDDTHLDVLPTLVQADDRDFSARAAPPFPTHPARTASSFHPPPPRHP